jgi:hypothetical protein
MNRVISTLISVAASGILLTSPVSSVAQEKTLKQQIQGPWSLVSCNSTTAKGEKTPNCASSNPRGTTILAGNGHFVSVTLAPGRKDLNSPGVTANFGTWSVNEADKTLTLHYEGAFNPTVEGKELKLNISLSGDELRLSGDASNLNIETTRQSDTIYRRFK